MTESTQVDASIYRIRNAVRAVGALALAEASRVTEKAACRSIDSEELVSPGARVNVHLEPVQPPDFFYFRLTGV